MEQHRFTQSGKGLKLNKRKQRPLRACEDAEKANHGQGVGGCCRRVICLPERQRWDMWQDGITRFPFHTADAMTLSINNAGAADRFAVVTMRIRQPPIEAQPERCRRVIFLPRVITLGRVGGWNKWFHAADAGEAQRAQ